MQERLRIVELAERSDTGRVRDHNEDRAVAAAHVIAVADGMGGALAGEVASQMAVDAIGAIAPPAALPALKAAIENANRAIRRLAAQDQTKAGMGTTMTAAIVATSQVEIAHVGDSRAYLWSDGELLRLTDDHSVVAEMVRQGSLSEEEAERHPHRNVITRALGAEPDVRVDTYEHPLAEGDVLLLCSDGLYGEVADAGIAEELARAKTLEEAAAALVTRANANGGSDNVTVVLARVGTGPEVEVSPRSETSDTAEIPALGDPHLSTEGRTTKVIGGVASNRRPEGEAASATPSVLERAPGRRRRRGPLVLVGVAVVALVVGAAAWTVSRSYALTTGPNGTVWVERGLAAGPLDLRDDWEDTGVSADALTVSLGGISGLGQTVRRAGEIVWTDGLAQISVPEAVAPDTRVPGVGPIRRRTAAGAAG